MIYFKELQVAFLIKFSFCQISQRHSQAQAVCEQKHWEIGDCVVTAPSLSQHEQTQSSFSDV